MRFRILERNWKKLDREIKELEYKQTKYLFVCKGVNSRLAKLDINKHYTGNNASEIRKELIAIKIWRKDRKQKRKI